MPLISSEKRISSLFYCVSLPLVKRDSPSSLSNLHHQTANASTNTPIHEGLCLSPFFTTAIGSKSPSSELSSGSTMKLANVPSSSTASLNSGHLTNKTNKSTSTPNQADHSSFNVVSRSETNQESVLSNEKKTLIVRYFRFSL